MTDSLFDPANLNTESRETETVLSVSRLNDLVKNRLEREFPSVTVQGEISNLKTPASGHSYFTLKDDQAEISAVYFRQRKVKSKARLEEGQEVTAVGRVSLYTQRGNYQLIIDSVKTAGKGDLRERFEKLVARLRKEGLFDDIHKKPLPVLPRAVGVITSATGAAVRDIINTIWNRYPGAHIVVGPVAVQGDKAAGEISSMIERFNTWGGVDVLIVGRGGGSLEDLWAFNEEQVARAIFASDIPVISAVGHEIDITVSDLAADMRALTPTRGGELAVPAIEQENQFLDGLHERAGLAIKQYFRNCRSALDNFRNHRIFTIPEESLRTRKREMSECARRMETAVRSRNALAVQQLKGLESVLQSLNPLAVLKRGFSYTEDADGKRIMDASALKAGDTVKTRLADGSFTSEVIEGT